MEKSALVRLIVTLNLSAITSSNLTSRLYPIVVPSEIFSHTPFIEASTVNASIRCPFCISSCSKSVFTGVVAVIFISKESPSFPVIFS